MSDIEIKYEVRANNFTAESHYDTESMHHYSCYIMPSDHCFGVYKEKETAKVVLGGLKMQKKYKGVNFYLREIKYQVISVNDDFGIE